MIGSFFILVEMICNALLVSGAPRVRLFSVFNWRLSVPADSAGFWRAFQVVDRSAFKTYRSALYSLLIDSSILYCTVESLRSSTCCFATEFSITGGSIHYAPVSLVWHPSAALQGLGEGFGPGLLW
jgi:hypothetical protein